MLEEIQAHKAAAHQRKQLRQRRQAEKAVKQRQRQEEWLQQLSNGDHLERTRSSWAAFSGLGAKRPRTDFPVEGPSVIRTKPRASGDCAAQEHVQQQQRPRELDDSPSGMRACDKSELLRASKNRWKHDKYEEIYGTERAAATGFTARAKKVNFVPGGVEHH